jgi:ABC-type dipeptide/oligopeptide/nickel transport system permease subunit
VAGTAQPRLLIAPAIAIATVTIAFTFLGDGLRDALDPREAQ